MQRYPHTQLMPHAKTHQISPASNSPAVQEWTVLKEMANAMISTGLISKSLARPEQVIFLIMSGNELGMGPMWSVQNLQIVDGKVSAKAEAMMALVYKNCPGAKITFLQNDDTACRLEASRPGCEPYKFGYSMDDAKKARLAEKDNWKKYPRAMLRSRAVAEVCRAVFPDAIAGISSYTPWEIVNMRKTDIKIEGDSDHELNYEPDLPPQQVTLNAAPPESPPKSIRQMLNAEFQLTEVDLAEFIGVPPGDLGPQHGQALRELYKDLKEGNLKREEVLEFSKEPIEG